MTRVRLATYHPRIPLASADESFCKVVAPRDGEWSQLAHRFCVRVGEYTLTTPEQVTPDVLTDDDYARFHLMLFGSILNNPAILRLYARHRCFTDDEYPGRGGVEIRSVVNPLGTGRNVLLIGGTDFAAVNEATIGLHRSFSQVTFERNGILWLHPLNFCTSSANTRWNPTVPETERLLRDALGNPTDGFHRLADCGLFHYRTDNAAWAELIAKTLLPLRDTGTTAGLEKFVLAWTLIYWSRAFSDEFRVETDAWLLEVGTRLAEQTTTLAVDSASFLKATALHRIREHFRCLHGTGPFDGVPDALPNADALRAGDDFRDWYACDVWLSRVFESERYDAIESYDLDSLAREALATVDNLKAPVGEPGNHRHAGNVLVKIAAFENDGRYVWLQRWLDDDGLTGGSGTESEFHPSGWYTGNYVSGLLPREPGAMPTVETVGLDAATRRFDGIAFRRNLDAMSDYLFLSRTGGVQRLTWDRVAWFTGGAWTEAPATLLRIGELPEAGYVSLDCGAYRRVVLWRHNTFFLIADRWSDASNDTAETAWSSAMSGDRQTDTWTVSNGFRTVRLVSADGTPLDRWYTWDAATKVIVLAFDPTARVRLTDDERVMIGEAACHVGRFADGNFVADCDTLLRERERLAFFGLRRLMVGGISRVEAPNGVDLSVRLPDGAGYLRVDRETTVRRSDKAGKTETLVCLPGTHDVEVADVDWTNTMRPLEGDGRSA